MVLGIGDEDVVVGIDAEMLRSVHRREQGFPAVAAESPLPGAGDGADLPLPIHDAQRVAAAIQDVDVAAGIDSHGAWIDQRAAAGSRAVHRHVPLAVPRDRLHDAGLQSEYSNAAVVEVGEIKVLGAAIQGDAIDVTKLRRCAGSTVAAVAPHAGSRHGRDDAARQVQTADAVVPGVGDVKVAVGREREAMGVV